MVAWYGNKCGCPISPCTGWQKVTMLSLEDHFPLINNFVSTQGDWNPDDTSAVIDFSNQCEADEADDSRQQTTSSQSSESQSGIVDNDRGSTSHL